MNKPITIKSKAQMLATYFGCTTDEIFGKNRFRNVIKARHTLYWYMYNSMKMSYPEIGKVFNCDPTSILNGVKKIEFYRQIEDDIAGAIVDIYEPFTSLKYKP